MLGSKVHFTTCFLWFVEIDHQHICHFLIFSFPVFGLCVHSLSLSLSLCLFLSQFVDCLPPFCPSLSLFFYSSLFASRDPFRVLCNVHFSFLIHWEVFNLPICYQSLRGNHMKEMNNMFPLNAVHSKKKKLFLVHCRWWLDFSKL